MKQYDVTLIAVDIRKWDLESNRLYMTTYFVMDDEEKTQMLELSITKPPEMVEEFLGKVRQFCQKKMVKNGEEDEEIIIAMSHETFLRQKLYSYFKRILMELNNPKRKKGQAKMIFTTHMDVYNENQDISFLPIIIQFYVVLNWARKYYDKENYQRAVEPLRKLIQIKPDFGLGYKWLARSLKKIRKYDEAMYFYEKYAEVDGSVEARLELAKSLRKGKVFDRAEQIYQEVLKEEPENREARIGLAQIRYARNDQEFLGILDLLYEEDPRWLRKWLMEEFNFRIYINKKTPLQPVLAARYLGYKQVFDMTQRAFKNEIPSHFNPSRARMSFYKEELDNWAMVMNRFKVTPTEIKLYPEELPAGQLKLVDVNEEEAEVEKVAKKPSPENGKTMKKSTKVEEVLRRLREARAAKERGKSEMQALREADAKGKTTTRTVPAKPEGRRRGRPPKAQAEGVESVAGQAPAKRRGRPPKKKVEGTVASSPTDSGEAVEKPKRRGRPPKKATETAPATGEGAEAPKKRRPGRPPKKKGAASDQKGRPAKNEPKDGGADSDLPENLELPGEKEFLMEPDGV